MSNFRIPLSMNNQTTQKMVRNIGRGLGYLTLLLDIGYAIFLSLLKHLVFSSADIFYLSAGVIIGIITILLWSNINLSYIGRHMPSPSESRSVADQRISSTNPDTLLSEVPTEPQSPYILMPKAGVFLLQDTNIVQPPDNNSSEERHPLPFQNSPPFVLSGQALYPQLPLVQEVRSFVFPKEGNDPERSQDKFALHSHNGSCRYAIADGVGASFLPSQWAQLLTTNYVSLKEDFKDKREFTHWLTASSLQWNHWVDTSWIPQTNQKLGYEKDWSRDKAKGAQTTFVGCSFSKDDLALNGSTLVHVTVVGDTVFFLIRPPHTTQDQWEHVSFACRTVDDFGPVPDTLATSEQYIQHAWNLLKSNVYRASSEDYIILATDALAKWILAQIQANSNPWIVLLALAHPQNFSEFVLQERQKGTLETDDTTMIIVPLQGANESHSEEHSTR